MEPVWDKVFEDACERWLADRIKSSRGERKRRLTRGLGYGEKMFLSRVWFPEFGHFEHLHPEFEVKDFKDGTRYLDFAYIKGHIRICIEVDSFGKHWRDLNLWEFADHLDRQNDLVNDDWKVYRFSFDKVKEKPHLCRQTILHALGKWGAIRLKNDDHPANPIDMAIMKVLLSQNEPLSPVEISREIVWNRSTIARHLKKMSERGEVLIVNRGTRKVTRYRPNPNR